MFLKEMLLSNLLNCVLLLTSMVQELLSLKKNVVEMSYRYRHLHWAIPEITKQGRKEGGGGGDLRTQLLFETKSWNFKVFYFVPGNSGQNKASRLEIPQNCVTLLGNSENKNQEPWKFHIIFS